MRHTIFVLAALLANTMLYAQTSGSLPNSVLSGQRSGEELTNRYGAGTLIITNQSGTAYSLEDLDRRLQSLQSEVDQTLPLLTAFNTSYAATNASGGTAKALGDLLGRVLSRGKKDSEENSSDSQSTTRNFSATNVLGVLQGLMNTNKSSTATISADTIAQLQSLQKALEPVLPLLQSLNGSGKSPVLTPTGR